MSDIEVIEIFSVEAADLLEQIESSLLEAAQRPGDSDVINRLFRAFHTIKGGSLMCGLEAVGTFTHHVENALHAVRDGARPMSPSLARLVLEAHDQIKRMLQNYTDPTLAQDPACARIVAALQAGEDTMVEPATAVKTPVAAPARHDRIRFTPSPQLSQTGFSIDALWEGLRALGECTVVSRGGSREQPVLEATLKTTCDTNAIRDVFIFVEGSGELQLTAADDPAAAATPVSIAAAPSLESAAATKTLARESTVRVSADKLDHLVNLVGEMVMNQSRLAQVAAASALAELAGPVEALERLVAEMRDSVLSIRMMPIGSTFNRFKRLVHDLAGELHKDIELVTEGAETELDKTVLDQLGDPLVHLIRNCIDHGIELPDVRARAGKPRRGIIRLAAAHEGGQVVVTIEDDGRGLDRDRIRAKAVAQRLIGTDASLSETEIFKLIFQPGFSTAETVTNVSGRGVGMDVVRKQLDALRGDIRITSQPGCGTTVRLTLPLTLAIIDGLLVEIGGDRFIIPMSAVMENVELTADERQRNNGRNLLTVRGELVPYLRLREVFEIRGGNLPIEKVVIVSHLGHRVGLVVDRVLGSHQTVIQPLGDFYRNIGVVSGSTIMGDGRVALIFDVGGLIAFTERQARLSPLPSLAAL